MYHRHRGSIAVRVSLVIIGIIVARLTYSSGVIGRVEVERISRLSQTVQVRSLRQTRSQTEVLRLKDQVCCRSVEKSLIGVSAADSK